MLPKVVSASDFRKNLAGFLNLSSQNVVMIKYKDSNKVVMDENEYNRLNALAMQFTIEDPEGEYRPEFVKEILKRAKDNDVDSSVSSLSDLL